MHDKKENDKGKEKTDGTKETDVNVIIETNLQRMSYVQQFSFDTISDYSPSLLTASFWDVLLLPELRGFAAWFLFSHGVARLWRVNKKRCHVRD